MMGEFLTPGELNDLRPAADAVEESLQFLHYTVSETFQIKLALEEAVVNAIKHGNRMDPDKRVHVVFRAAPDRFDVCITDEGDGFASAEPTGGRGLLLMNTFMTEVRSCGRGNVVAMAYVRPPA